MSNRYTYLDLKGVVGRRTVKGRTFFQPEGSDRNVEQVIGMRLTLSVLYAETIIDSASVILDGISVEIDLDGKVLINADFNGET